MNGLNKNLEKEEREAGGCGDGKPEVANKVRDLTWSSGSSFIQFYTYIA